MDRGWMRRVLLGLFLLCTVLVWTGCRPSTEKTLEEGEMEMAIQITSTAFSEAATIPKKHTCDGQDVSPQLSWSGVPEGTQSLALIMDDPDAPMGTFVHWVLYDIPPDVRELPEGVQGVGVQGVNDFRRTSYNGPCPPRGLAHRYYFKVYALDITLGLKAGARKADVEKAMQGHILAWGQLMGRYGR